MNDTKIDWQYLFLDSRARVYLLWSALVTVGFLATHFYQDKFINAFWTLLSVIGIYYMFKVMPLKVKQMQHIYYGWFITIAVGMAVSGFVFYLELPVAGYLINHLGAFWLVLMAQAYAGNGFVDKPGVWYWFAAGLNLLFGVLIFSIDALIPGQYLIAAVVSAWSMLYLWLFRSYT